tara:strand:- start:1249 stop:1659 length:411 start_codon:yes stop_codon:yes gene_type:complete
MSTQMSAVDEMLTLVKTAWDSAAGGAPLYYDNMDADRPSTPGTFGRAIVRHFSGRQISMGDQSTKRRFGALFIQIFMPQGTGQYDIRTLSDSILFALEDANPLVARLTDIQLNELGTDGTYYQVNVVADFSYDRVS